MNQTQEDVLPSGKPPSRMLLKSMMDAGATSFGKAFVLYALPMSVLRREVKKAILLRASALAAFMGIAKAVQMLLSHQKYEIARRYSQAIAGGLAAMSALSIDKTLGSNTLVIWIALRAARCMIEENGVGKFLSYIPFKPTIVMCISAAQILSTWVRHPYELDPGYCKFLNYQGGRPKWASQRFIAPNAPVSYPFNVILKPGTGIVSDSIQFFFAGLKRAATLYTPLYAAALIFALCQQRNRTSDRLPKVFSNFLSNVIRSSAFLSLYCTIAWSAHVLLWFISRKSWADGATRVSLRRHVWMAGLATLIERKERRSELASYCLTYALDSVWRRMERSTPILAEYHPIFAGILLTLSCSVLLHHYNKQPTLVTKYILDFDTTVDEKEKKNENEKKL